MRYLKHILFLSAVIFAATSCKKLNDIQPSGTKVVKPIDTDEVIHHISFKVSKQFIVSSVSGSTLTMIYYENVNLLIPDTGLDLSYALHLKEDFTKSVLNNFDYTTVDNVGNIDQDWVDDNLNDVPTKTLKDTLINGAKMTEINVQRPFTFAKTYTDNQSAIDEEHTVLQSKSDIIGFTSYVYFTKVYPATTTTAKARYVKEKGDAD